ncbi:hypothetical protein [Natrarchaeobaculum sulfurireducens]|uniref:Envelope protein N-terminal domain-containing protein n=1 Tax=Natrarchaeobaculum sulfurireducens TaxID=2044521 RepID=A0A346PG45_9EURY|nr:hypothetical protein [Natrarchaeobaculum sulfurireducens]AXR78490.1 hypothetical protein AArc1_2174 [Natrarchaeobaculum sulfurireducens]
MTTADDSSPRPTTHDHPADVDQLLENDATRRGILRGLGAAGTVTLAGAASSGTVAADARTDPASGSTGRFYTAAGWAVDTFDSFTSSGYDEEEVKEQLADQQRHEIAMSADQLKRHVIEGDLHDFLQTVQPDDVESSEFFGVLLGELDTAVFETVVDGGDPIDAENEAMDRINEVASDRVRNLLRSLNELMGDLERHFATFEREQGDDGDYYIDEEDETDAGLEAEFTFQPPITTGYSRVKEIDVELWSGDTETVRVLESYISPSSRSIIDEETEPDYLDTPVPSRFFPDSYDYDDHRTDRTLTVQDEDYEDIDLVVEKYNEAISAVREARDEIIDNIGEYIEDVMEEVDSGELDEHELLSPTDVMDQYGDVEGMDYVAASAMARGMDVPDDLGYVVEIEHEDVSGQEGMVFANMDYSSLRETEYEYDPDAGELVIDPDSIMDGAIYTVEFEDSDSASVAWGQIDTDDGIVDDDVSDDTEIPSDDAVEEINVHTSAQLRSFVEEGETLSDDHYNTILFSYEGGSGTETETIREGDVKFVSIEKDGEDVDRMRLEGFETTTRDPALALDVQRERADGGFDLDELEDAGGILPGIDIDAGTGAAVGGAFAGVLIIAAVVFTVVGWFTDLLPWT